MFRTWQRPDVTEKVLQWSQRKTSHFLAMISSPQKASTTYHKHIAPKMSSSDNSPDAVSSSTVASSSSSSNVMNNMRCRRKIAFHPTLGYAIPAPQPPKVARRNARERNRVKQVNQGFEMLRSHIPSAAKQKKMSKVETLRHAVEYIQNLQHMIMDQEDRTKSGSPPSSSHPPPPPLTLMSPATSSATPTTQHYVSTPSNYHQNSPQGFQYPSPLTPRTPNTPSSAQEFSAHFGHAHMPVTSGNESGYETSSYYSHSSSMMSPQGMISQLSQPSQFHPRPSSTSSSSSPPMTAATSAPQEAFQESYSSMDFYGNQSEEDELLDVIAKWQDQDDWS